MLRLVLGWDPAVNRVEALPADRRSRLPLTAPTRVWTTPGNSRSMTSTLDIPANEIRTVSLASLLDEESRYP